MLDFKEVALEIRAEQNQVSGLLQALHGFVANQLQPPLQQQPHALYPPPYPGQGGGMLRRFMGSGFSQSITMGAGFGIGDDLVNTLFGGGRGGC